jgi:hypothetical protein
VKGKAIPLLMLIVLVALLPALVSADGAHVIHGQMFSSAVLLWEEGSCPAPDTPWAAVLWLREDPPPDGFESEFLVDGTLVSLPEEAQPYQWNPPDVPDIWHFGGHAHVYVYFCEDLEGAGFLDENGVFDPGNTPFILDFFYDPDSWLRDLASLDYTGFQYNHMQTDRLLVETMSAQGDHFDFFGHMVWHINGNVNFLWRFEWE